jgi:stage V sporulation protein S
VSQLKVSARSNPNAVAGAFAGVVREQGRAEVHVIGAGALNQAMKAVAIARGYLAEAGVDLVCVPSFVVLEVDGEERTAIHLLVEDRAAVRAPAIAAAPAAPAPAVDLSAALPPADAVDDLRVVHEPSRERLGIASS